MASVERSPIGGVHDASVRVDFGERSRKWNVHESRFRAPVEGIGPIKKESEVLENRTEVLDISKRYLSPDYEL